MKKILLLLLLFVSSQSFAVSQVQTAKYVDINSYLGKWYEIASIPPSFEKQCVKNTTAEYSMADAGLLKVLNSCETINASRSSAEGRAKIVDKESNAKLKVTFVRFIGWIFAFSGKYWILDVAPDYSYAVVGDPSRHYAWILARTPSVSDAVLDSAERVLSDQGFDTCKLFTTVQDGGLSEKIPLCQITDVH